MGNIMNSHNETKLNRFTYTLIFINALYIKYFEFKYFGRKYRKEKCASVSG